MQEGQSIKRHDGILPNTETHSLARVLALKDVLRGLNLPCRIVANEGALYPDGTGRVPKGAAFVTYDTGKISTEAIWRIVDEISPIPMMDGKK